MTTQAFFPRAHRPSASRPVVLQILRALMIPGLLIRAAEPGSLDPAFDPPQAYQGPHRFLVKVGPHLYLPRGNGVQRLADDGSPDPEWRLKAPLDRAPETLVPTPWGGFVVGDATQTYLEHPDGTFRRVVESSTRWFPQPDGSILRHPRGGGVARWDPEGRVIASYPLLGRIGGVSFVNPSGSSSIGGGGARVAVADRRGRLIVGGAFVSSGGLERLGLVRLLADGRPDPAWNPGALLGIATTNAADPEILANFQGTPPTNFITARPSWMVLGTNDSVVVGIEYVAPRGSPDHRVAVISEQGEVVSVFSDEPLSGLAVRCVQPDGRLLMADYSLETWQGNPVGKLIRVQPDGTLDPSFVVTLHPPGSSVSAMTLDDQGRLWISGSFTAVNGVARPGLARLLAYAPAQSAPQLAATVTRPRIAEGQVLFLAAATSEGPATALQWLRNGIPIPDAVSGSLRLPVVPGTLPAEFQLMAWNSHGTNTLDFGRTDVGIPSPRPGVAAPQWGVRLTNVFPITRLVPLPDGRVLFGAGTSGDGPVPLVGRLTAAGVLDPAFGSGGIVEGDGRVEDLIPQAAGSVFVVGSFSSLGGVPASGIAELSGTGQRIPREFPVLDVPSVSTLLALPDGQWILAGRFRQVSGVPRFRLARLTSNFALDPGFDAAATFQPWQVVDVLALDRQGRLLAGGSGLAFEGSLTNPAPYGMVRLLPNGGLDPEFSRVPTSVRSIFVEADGRMVTGMPLNRWDGTGQLVTAFLGNPPLPDFGVEPNHRLVRLPDGSFVAPIEGISLGRHTIRRWLPDGRIDDRFVSPFEGSDGPNRITACAALPDGSLLIAVMDGRGGAVIRRVLPDSDLQLADPEMSEGELRAGLYTQPGRRYRVLSRDSLGVPAIATGGLIEGDGYWTPVGAAAPGAQGYLHVVREPAGE